VSKMSLSEAVHKHYLHQTFMSEYEQDLLDIDIEFEEWLLMRGYKWEHKRWFVRDVCSTV